MRFAAQPYHSVNSRSARSSSCSSKTDLQPESKYSPVPLSFLFVLITRITASQKEEEEQSAKLSLIYTPAGTWYRVVPKPKRSYIPPAASCCGTFSLACYCCARGNFFGFVQQRKKAGRVRAAKKREEGRQGDPERSLC